MQPVNTGGYRRRYLDLVAGLVELSGSNWGNLAGAGSDSSIRALWRFSEVMQLGSRSDQKEVEWQAHPSRITP
jgi:hypothetical protein